MDWKKLSIYLATSYPDMFAEREYLRREVKPELEEWCRERNLELDWVDLRFGISEKDAEENVRALRVCLENIDACRPFFVGFLGQHRGWVPTTEDAGDGLLKEYDGLEACIGKYSLTELEILHALLRPLKDGEKPAEHGILYYRDADFTRDAFKDQSKLKSIFTNEPWQKSLFSRENKRRTEAQEAFRKEAEKQLALVKYQARWDKERISPELKDYCGRDLSEGRLTDFQILGRNLKDHLLSFLKAEIVREYPDRKQAAEKPVDRPASDMRGQEICLRRFLRDYSEAAVPEKLPDAFLNLKDGSRVALSARGGMGKTEFLAHYIEELSRKGEREVYYRFGRLGANMVTLKDQVYSLYLEMMERVGLAEEWKPLNDHELEIRFPEVVKLAGRGKPIALVLDGLRADECEKLPWVFESLPETAILVYGARPGEVERLSKWIGGSRVELMPVNDPKQRKKMIRQAVFDVLKDVDEEEMNLLLSSQGSANPLFLKAAVNELRYGGNKAAWKKMASGEDGISAGNFIRGMLTRMEMGENCYLARPDLEVKAFFGFLAAGRRGISPEGYRKLFSVWAETDYKKIGAKRLREDMLLMAEQAKPFLLFDGSSYWPMQESFAEVLREYYKEDMNSFHRVLAALYYDKCDKFGNGTFSGEEAEAFQEVIYHSAKGRWEWVLSLLKDPNFLIGKMKKNGLPALIEDYAKIDAQVSPKYQKICRLLWLSIPVLEQDPEQLEAQIMIRRGEEPEPVFDEMLEKLGKRRTGWFLSPLQKYGANLDDFDQLAEEGFLPEPSGNNEMLDLFQSSGSLYLFSQKYSVAVSPLNLQIRKTGAPVLACLPEVLKKKYLLHWDAREGMLMLYNLETLQNDQERRLPREVTEKVENAWWDENRFYVLYRSLVGKGTMRIFTLKSEGPVETYTLEKAEDRRIVTGPAGARVWEVGCGGAEWRLRDISNGEEKASLVKMAGVRVRDAFYENGSVIWIQESEEETAICLRRPEGPEEERKTRVVYTKAGGEDLCLRGHQGNQVLYQYEDGTFFVFDIQSGTVSKEYLLTEERIAASLFEKNLVYAVLESGQLCVYDLDAGVMRCRSFLEAPVRKMVMAGAGLVTIWTTKGELLSFQLQKKK
ncbi:MAG: DUF4062 domain-containing protein [Lachnospiraceae bacterium]|nr:DUF4062 domain-containing protein [Lachnospiraceae bacterium]